MQPTFPQPVPRHREDAAVWNDAVEQMLLWAFVIAEIPLQVDEYERRLSKVLKQRVDELLQLYPAEWEKAEEKRRARSHAGRMRCSLLQPENARPGDCLSATIERGEWGLPDYRAVRFGICHRGIVNVRSQGQDGELGVPSFLRGSRDLGTARERARLAVEGAVRFVARGDLAL